MAPSSPAPRRPPGRRPTTLAAAAAAVLALGALSCGGSDAPVPIDDPGASASGQAVPGWFPAQVQPPPGSVVVEVIDDPAEGFGRTVTWRARGDFEEVADHVDRLLAGLGWTPTEEAETAGDVGARRRTWFLENDSVYSIRIFEDESLEGVRLAVELAAAG